MRLQRRQLLQRNKTQFLRANAQAPLGKLRPHWGTVFSRFANSALLRYFPKLWMAAGSFS